MTLCAPPSLLARLVLYDRKDGVKGQTFTIVGQIEAPLCPVEVPLARLSPNLSLRDTGLSLFP
jgi:hypothetical protein